MTGLTTLMIVPRIYADYNALVPDPKERRAYAVLLDGRGSLMDLHEAGITLSVGLRITAFDYSDEFEDIESTGIVSFNTEHKAWQLEFDGHGIIDVPAGDRTPKTACRCFSCRTDIFELIMGPSRLDEPCPGCGAPLNRPLAPPTSD